MCDLLLFLFAVEVLKGLYLVAFFWGGGGGGGEHGNEQDVLDH